MNKQQLILIIGSLATVAGLYFFGPTVAPTKNPVTAIADSSNSHNLGFNLDSYEQTEIAALSQERQRYIAGLKESVKRGDVKDQAIHVDHQLARFWKDSVPNPLLHFNFTSKAAELDNNEKTLTFAAHSILGYLPFAQNQQEQAWLAGKGKQLFEKVVKGQPNNLEAMFKLAEAYEQMGDKAKAITWYQVIHDRVSEAEMKTAIEKRIEELKK